MANMINDTDRSEIRAWHRRWIERNLDRDFEGLAALYTDDAITMPPNAPSIRGKEENIAFWRAATILDIDIVIEEIEGYEDLAYVLGTYSMTYQPEGADEPIEDRGKYIEIRRKQPDGRWPISRDIFNSDLDGPSLILPRDE